MKKPKLKPTTSKLVPTHVRVGWHTYTLNFDTDALGAASHRLDAGETLLGLTDTKACCLYIDGTMAESQVQETLFHELLHVIFEGSGATAEIDHNTQEKIVLSMSPMILQVLRDNPQIVKFLGILPKHR